LNTAFWSVQAIGLFTVTWKLPFPVPEEGETMMFGWLEETVQLTPVPPLNETVIDCGSVIKELLTPKLRAALLSDIVVVGPAGPPFTVNAGEGPDRRVLIVPAALL
jgi:hypothetical protein